MFPLSKASFKSIFPVTIFRLLLVYLAFQVTRVGFYLFNASLFQDLSLYSFLSYMKAGLLFDTSAILYTNALFLISSLVPFPFRYRRGYQIYLKSVFFVFNGIALAANVSDFIYYRFTLRRTTADVFSFMKNEDNMGKLWFQFVIDYWPALVFWIVTMVSLWFLWRLVPLTTKKPKGSIGYVSVSLLVLLLTMGLMIAGFRGGFKHSTRPITLSNAGKYIDRPEHAAIVLNTPFCIFRTLNKPGLEKINYFTETEARRLFDPVHVASAESFKPHNVVILILESFTREIVGYLNKDLEDGYKGYTPFLDSLMTQSVVFTHAYANGRKSIDAIPAVIAGIPCMSLPYVLTPYSNNTINSLASCLNMKNYQTSFFHGAPNGSMGFDSFCKMAGFKNYYGLDEYGNKDDFDGMWGVWDEPMLQFMKGTLDAYSDPFLAVLFSVSSHHPFKLPKAYKDTFPKGPLPLYECAGYTDHALRQFFKEAKKSAWYQNTLFVITADHSTVAHHAEYKNSIGAHSIPILMFMPSELEPKTVSVVMQQTDIFPTVLNFLNFDEPYLAFGNDALASDGDHFAIYNYGNAFQLVKDNWLLQIAEDVPVGMYNVLNDRFLKHNSISNEKERIASMMLLYRSFQQQYNNRLLENKMQVN